MKEKQAPTILAGKERALVASGILHPSWGESDKSSP